VKKQTTPLQQLPDCSINLYNPTIKPLQSIFFDICDTSSDINVTWVNYDGATLEGEVIAREAAPTFDSASPRDCTAAMSQLW
jgi:hypothetical protein